MLKISVIVPVYNAENTLSNCVDSIINQTYKNLDILLIDDGSTDNSLNICKHYQKIDSRIQLLCQENKGPSAARNKGINNTKGHYIMFIDSDDYIDEDLIEGLVRQLEEEKSDIIFYGYSKEYVDSKQIVQPIKEVSIDIGDIVYKLFENNLFGYSCNKIFSKSICIENKVFFQENENLYEDQYFFCEYVKYVNKISISNKFGYHYIINNQSLSSKKRDNLIELQNNMFNYLKEFTILIGMDKDKAKNLLYKYAMEVYYIYMKTCCKENTVMKDKKKVINKFENTDIYIYYSHLENKKNIYLNNRDKIVSKILDINNIYLKIFIFKLMIKVSLIK